MNPSDENESTKRESLNGAPLSIERLEEIFDAVFEDLPPEGVLTDAEYQAYQKAGFVSVIRGGRFIIYVDPDRYGRFTH